MVWAAQTRGWIKNVGWRRKYCDGRTRNCVRNDTMLQRFDVALIVENSRFSSLDEISGLRRHLKTSTTVTKAALAYIASIIEGMQLHCINLQLGPTLISDGTRKLSSALLL